MTRPTPSTRLAVILATVASFPIGAVAAALPACKVANGQTATYDIRRGDNVIGQQTVRFAVNGPDLTVTIDVTASLRALGIRVYHYQHHGEEQWRDGQMVRLVTRTDDDGTPRQVNAARDPQTGVWHGVTGMPPGPAPLLSTSMWNIQTVLQTRLLDRETGEVIPVRATPAGEQTLQLGGRQIVASKYDLAGPVKGTVWYDANGCWLQALFHTRVDGSLIDLRLH